MDFLWRIHLDPALPFLLLPRTRENGQDGGVQAICRFDCTWDQMHSSMVGLLEQVSERAWMFLRQHHHPSIIEIEDIFSRQDHRAILFGPMKFLEHRCQTDVWFGDKVLQTVSTTVLKDPTRTNPVGFLDRADSGTMLLRMDRPFDVALNCPFRTRFCRYERLVIDYVSGHRWPRGVPDFPGGCDCALCLPGGAEQLARVALVPVEPTEVVV
jgi:hypothetical protein